MISKYIPTDEQRKYLDQEIGKIVLNACPGSGKTTTIVHKLAKLIPKYERRNKYAGVLCISFTNIAKEEIIGKYQKLCNTNIANPHLVCTIDHFINSYITLPFYHKLNKDFVRPKIIEDSSFLDDLNLWWKFKTKKDTPLFKSYPPHTIELEFNSSYSSNGKKPNTMNIDINTFNNYCKTVKD